MSKTLKMIVKELPKTMGQLNHELLLEDLKIALKEVVALKQQLQQAHRAGWEQAKREAKEAVREANYDLDDWSRRNPEYVASGAVVAMSYDVANAALEYTEPTDD